MFYLNFYSLWVLFFFVSWLYLCIVKYWACSFIWLWHFFDTVLHPYNFSCLVLFIGDTLYYMLYLIYWVLYINFLFDLLFKYHFSCWIFQCCCLFIYIANFLTNFAIFFPLKFPGFISNFWIKLVCVYASSLKWLISFTSKHFKVLFQTVTYAVSLNSVMETLGYPRSSCFLCFCVVIGLSVDRDTPHFLWGSLDWAACSWGLSQ